MYRLYFCGLGIVMILSKEKTERLKVFIFYLRETASNIAKKNVNVDYCNRFIILQTKHLSVLQKITKHRI